MPHITRAKLCSILAGTIIVVVSAGLLFPAMQRSSNCGGNSAALAACEGYITVLRIWTENHPGTPFDFATADEDIRADVLRLPGTSWIRSARLLAKLSDVTITPGAEKKVIMVCDRAYNNVPRKLLGKAPMAHAVAYSNGDTGLISPAEFAKLDLRGFVDLQALSNSNNIARAPSLH